MSLGKDLASIRKSKNLSLEDIQNAIKIPLDTLKNIENDSIFSDPNENKTYVRSFVRSYAKVLKIEDDEIIKALDEQEAGTYTGRLIGEPSQPEEEESLGSPNDEDTPASAPKPQTESPQKEKRDEKPKTTPPPPKVEPIKKAEPVHEEPAETTDSINWADMGHKFTPTGRNSKIWLVALLVIVILGALGGTGYYFSDDLIALFEQDPQVTVDEENNNESSNPATTPADTLEAAGSESTANNSEEAEAEDVESEEVSAEPITLGDTLSVAVYAAYGQLEPIRVTSDFNWRTNPFWMEEGEAYWFDFNDTLLVRGQYSRILLLFNGHVIENPRNNYFDPDFNSIMITRDILDQPQYLEPAPEEFPLDVGAPDSITYRIQF